MPDRVRDRWLAAVVVLVGWGWVTVVTASAPGATVAGDCVALVLALSLVLGFPGEWGNDD